MVTIDLRLINYKCSIDTYHKMSPDISVSTFSNMKMRCFYFICCILNIFSEDVTFGFEETLCREHD